MYPNYQSTLSSMFMQPSGTAYILNNSIDVSNVPIGSGVSVAICPTESLMYIKLYQNNQPIVQAYTLIPYDAKSREHELENIVKELTSKVDELEKKLSTPIIESALKENKKEEKSNVTTW